MQHTYFEMQVADFFSESDFNFIKDVFCTYASTNARMTSSLQDTTQLY